jgi:hypothetical protein
MSNRHDLIKSLASKITCREAEKYSVLQQNAHTALTEFKNAQSVHVTAARKAEKKYGRDKGDPLYVRQLADIGFECEHKFFKTTDARNLYETFLRKKYL